MNKNVSLAIEKAVGSINQKNQNELKNNGPKKPDLFSLSGETELFQNERGITIKVDRSRDSNLTYIRYENVGHVTSWNADPDNYVYQLDLFLGGLD